MPATFAKNKATNTTNNIKTNPRDNLGFVLYCHKKAAAGSRRFFALFEVLFCYIRRYFVTSAVFVTYRVVL